MSAATITILARKPHRGSIIFAAENEGSEATLSAIDKACSFAIEGSHFIRRAKHIKGWDGKRHLFSKLTGGFPIGLFGRVVEVLRTRNVKFKLIDERKFQRFPEIKAGYLKGIKLAKHQLDAINSVLKKKGGILHLATNCLSGNTVIEAHRAGKSFKIKLKDLHHKFNGGAIDWGYGDAPPVFWDKDITTKARCKLKNGSIVLRPIKRIFASGKKVTYLVKTESGLHIRATEEHRFLTERGYVRLKFLQPGDTVYVDGGQTRAGAKQRRYLSFGGMDHHPFKAAHQDSRPGRRTYYSVQAHRIVMEASLNRLPVEVYLSLVRSGSVKGLRFVDPEKQTVHHKDGNTRNNDPLNLELKDRIKHLQEHAKVNWRNFTAQAKLDCISYIGAPKVQQTFDIEMESKPHNFLANGFVVHNSGKTECGVAAAKAIDKITLWIVPGRLLLKQTRERIAERLGVPVKEIGEIGAGKFEPKKITVAITASLNINRGRSPEVVFQAKKKRLRDYLKTVEVLIADEVHHAGSASWWRPLSSCPALYRIGLSGTPLDRMDNANMLVEGLCGPVVSRVTNQDLIDIDWSAKPTIEIYEVHDKTCADLPSWQEAYKLGVVNSAYRNELIVRRAIKDVENGDPVLILCREIEHANNLHSAFEVRGVKSAVAHAQLAKGKADKAMLRFVKGKVDILIGSPMFGEGIDLPGDRIRSYINAEGLMSVIRTLQKFGRSARKKKDGTNEVKVVEFADLHNRHLAKHALKRIELYESEGFSIVSGSY